MSTAALRTVGVGALLAGFLSACAADANRTEVVRLASPAGPVLATAADAPAVTVRPEPGVVDPAAPPGAMASPGHPLPAPGQDC